MAERIGQAYVELSTKGAQEVKSALASVQGSLLNLRTALAATVGGVSIIGLAKEFVQVGSQVEQFRLTLRTVIRDAKEADKAFDWARQFARTTPFGTEEVIRAYTLLKSVGIKYAEETMTAIGDAAMVFGRSIEDTAGALISMETEVWRRFGVEIDRSGKEWTVKLGDRIVRTKADIASLREALVQLLREGFEGGMKRAENTWKGAMETISSLWWEFAADVAGDAGSGGVFDSLRQAIVQVKDTWSAWVTSDEYRRFIADVQAKFLTMIRAVLNGMAAVVTAVDKIVAFVNQNPMMAEFGVIGYLLFGRRGLAIGAVLGGVADQVGKLLDTMKSSGLTTTGEEGKDFWGVLPKVPGQGSTGQPVAKGPTGVLEGFANGLRDLAANIGKVSSDAAAGAAKVAGANGILAGGSGTAGSGKGSKTKSISYSDETKKLAEALGVSAAEAERRLTAARSAAEETAAAVARLVEQEDLRKEILQDVEEGERRFAQEMAEEMRWSYEQGLSSAREYFEYAKEQLAEATAGTREWRDAFAEAQGVAESLASGDLQAIKTLFDEGRLTANQYRDALNEILAKYADFPNALQDVKSEMERVNDQTKQWIDDFKMGVVDAILGARSFLDVLKEIGREILKAMLYKFLWGESGMLSFLGFHAGGVVGWDAPTFTRKLALPLPRFHGGGVIGGDERLAILQTGERVLSRDQNRDYEQGGGTTVISINIKAIDAVGVQDFFEKNKGAVESIVTKNLWGNGRIRTVLQSM